MPDKHVLTGCLDKQESNILFFNDGYTFTFMSDTVENSLSNFKTQEGFLKGTTHSGKKVAIKTGSLELPIPLNKVILPVSLYFESVQDRDTTDAIQSFCQIRFRGGVLNKLGVALVGMNVLDEQRKQQFITPDGICSVHTKHLNHKTYKLLLTQEEKYFVLDLCFEKEQPLRDTDKEANKSYRVSQ